MKNQNKKIEILKEFLMTYGWAILPALIGIGYVLYISFTK